jgi:hypothetical protein
VRGGWDLKVAALPSTKCINILAWQACSEALSSILDFAVAGLAILVLRDLQMNTPQKVGLVVLFLLTTV